MGLQECIGAHATIEYFANGAFLYWVLYFALRTLTL